jgi:putative heme-binding domain-containing protein
MLWAAVGWAADPFAEGVRTTPWLSPADEQKQLAVPPGFEVQLVAAEPQIAKPLNMAFDDRGRLWITDTVEYPFAAPSGRPARDSIKILEDADGDGRAERITTFADNLNIPIGLLPYGDGVIAFGIPNIWYLRDTDGDGRADKREVLYGPFDHTRDTHGLNNAFRRGFDGWIYACHGYNNHSRVRGRDGNRVDMQSGNTYRFRPDGQRIEQFTWGQVNPFGMATDSLGNLFTADCHSKPVYQLLRGGYYPSFGKPHEGLGFVPEMMDHLHGSTAICGLAVYEDEHFPPEFRGNLFSGNVMTSRVNRNSPVYHGSTIKAKEEPDFVVSKDPWFRPVDILLGPDGALYVADFYNRIIGHYEVDLRHPGRDRTSGRIWRIVYKGTDKSPAKKATALPADLTKMSLEQLVATLDDPNLTLALAALNRIVDRYPSDGAAAVAKAFDTLKSGRLRSRAIWALHRLGGLTEQRLTAAAGDADRLPRVHAMKVLAETQKWSDAQRRLALAGLNDADNFVARAAADALGRHAEYGQVRPLLAALGKDRGRDNHLVHTIRMALRDHLRHGDYLTRLADEKLSDRETAAVASIALAVPTPTAGAYLLRILKSPSFSGLDLAAALQHVARYADAVSISSLGEVARFRLQHDIETQLNLIKAVQSGLQQRGVSPYEPLRFWAENLAGELLDMPSDKSISWSSLTLGGQPQRPSAWVVQPRAVSDGKRAFFYSSLPRGESMTGIFRSAPFEAPRRLRFYLAGHAGFPNEPMHEQNFVRLCDAESGAVIATAPPPRNDVAQRVEWLLPNHAGKRVYFEMVDGDSGRAYAWIAVGRFSHLPLEPDRNALRLQTAAELVGSLRLVALKGRLVERLSQQDLDAASQAAIGDALAALADDSRAKALAAALAEADRNAPLRAKIAGALAQPRDEMLKSVLVEAVQSAPQRLQLTIAEALAADGVGAAALVELIEKGVMGQRVLARPSVKQRLQASARGELAARVRELAAQLPPENKILASLIEERRGGFSKAGASAEKGAAVFAKHCAACHQIAGQGTVVGPQLDGIGNRGLDRLLEDVIDPNRNVDVAFHTTTLVMADGRVVTGLFRREAGATLVLADDKGKEFTINKDDVQEQKKSPVSIMPANVGEVIGRDEFYDLMAHLLRQRGK